MLFFLISLTYGTMIVGATAPEITVQSLDGHSVTGELIDLTSDGDIVHLTEGKRKIPLGDLGKVRFPASATAAEASPSAGLQIQLVDQTELAAKSFTAIGDVATIVWDSGDAQTVPLTLIRSVNFVAGDSRLLEAWKRLRDKPRRGDRLAVRKGKQIDYVEGVISRVAEDHVDFDLDGESIPVKWSKLAGLLFADRPTKKLEPIQCQLMTVSGSQLPVSAWKSNPEGFSLQLPCGLTFEVPYRRVQSIDFSQEKIIYLSEMKPIVTEWTPYLAAGNISPLLARFYGPQKDRSGGFGQGGTSGRLEIVGLSSQDSQNESSKPSSIESYAHGLSLQSKSRLIYDLPPESRRFEARAGIDAGSVQIGDVHFEIRGDGRSLYAEYISGRTGPRDVSVAVTGVQKLELIVDYGKNQDTGDRLNLCNARIIK